MLTSRVGGTFESRGRGSKRHHVTHDTTRRPRVHFGISHDLNFNPNSLFTDCSVMSGKPPTRTSTRLKTATAIQPPTTRATRARTATTTKARDSTARKTTARNVVVNKANDSEVMQQLKLKPTTVRKTRKQENGPSDVDREPIMVNETSKALVHHANSQKGLPSYSTALG